MAHIPQQPQTDDPPVDAHEQVTSCGAGESSTIRPTDVRPGSPSATDVATGASAPLADDRPAPAPEQREPAGGGGGQPGAGGTERLREAVVRELILNDIAYRRRDGEVPTAEEYLDRYPDLDRAWLADALAVPAKAQASLPTQTPSRAETDTDLNASPRPPTPLAPPPSLPKRFGDYELLEEVARGGMGVVYKARQLSLGRIVALKMILHGEPVTGETVKRFHREARAAAALDHPNIVAVHASGDHDGHPFFTMAYVEGDTLHKRVRRDGLPTPVNAVALLLAVTEAVSFAHRHGVIHRDLKPENVLIDCHGRPRVTDFGVAYQPQAQAAADRLTMAGQVLGTPAYMSPEQASGEQDAVGPPTDVYGLGGILYFLLTGQPPFQGRSTTDLLVRVITQVPTPPRQVNPGAPEALEAVCLRCLEKDPGRRYPSAEALSAALLDASRPQGEQVGSTDVTLQHAERPSIPSAEPVSAPAPSWAGGGRRSGRPRIARAVLIVAALAGLAVGAWLVAAAYWLGPEDTPAPAVKSPPVPPTPAAKGPSAQPEPVAKGPTAQPEPAAKGPSAQPAPAVAAPMLAAAELKPPAKLRADFDLSVVMAVKRPGAADLVPLQPDADGILRLREGDEVKFRVKSGKAAYVGIWSINADGTIAQLFPNADEKDHLFKPGEERVVPQTRAEAEESKGTDWIWVQASTKAWDPDQGERVGPWLLFRTDRERGRGATPTGHSAPTGLDPGGEGAEVSRRAVKISSALAPLAPGGRGAGGEGRRSTEY